MIYTRTLFMVTLCTLMMACSSQKKATTSPAPPIMENELTEITVREEKVQPVDLPDETVYKYYVVIGSFKVIENARKFRVDLVKEDFLPVILENENGLFRVSVASTD
ncbi:MAG: SPOR domain-containing protein, partial [Bacteroidales bacterium]|nr:SPOR domain-containing protein [Bacteroidales bacterium]